MRSEAMVVMGAVGGLVVGLLYVGSYVEAGVVGMVGLAYFVWGAE